MVTLSADELPLVLVTVKTCVALGPSIVVGGLTVKAGAEPVVIATVGAGAAVLVPCTLALPDCGVGDATAVILIVHVPSGAMDAQPVYTGVLVNCA